jgi:hypothetical protein
MLRLLETVQPTNKKYTFEGVASATPFSMILIAN